MPPKGDLLAARVAVERAWAYEAWMSRLTYSQMRRAVAQPVERGGLGYDLSESALKGLVTQAREDRGDLTMTREDRVERQGAEVDSRALAARDDYGRARTMAELPRPEASEYRDIETYVTALGLWVKAQETALKLTDSADRRLDAAHKREAALHGLDAPTRAEVEVTTHDAVVDELNTMLARLDPKAVKT